jgi:hypothetical protein
MSLELQESLPYDLQSDRKEVVGLLVRSAVNCESSGVTHSSSPSGGLAVREYAMAAEPGRLRPKYVQIRPDQWTALDDLARELQDAKSTRGGERITANTVIRIGIDLVLELSERLAGESEREIRQGLFEQLGLAQQEDG